MTYSTSQVADAAQVSLRQLQWWDERKLVHPIIKSHKRSYDDVSLFRVLLVAAMRSKGVSLQRIRAVLHSLHTRDLMANSQAVLLIRRRGLRICNRETALEACELESGAVVVICVRSLLSQMQPRQTTNIMRRGMH